MQVNAREDIEAPLDRVFAELTDFEAIERRALRRGIEIRRTDGLAGPQAGMAWQTTFRFRGKPRDATVILSEMKAPETLVFTSNSGGLDIVTRVDLVALSRGRTRVSVESELMPKTLSARLLVQSLKLAKGNINTRFRKRVGLYAKELEDRLNRMA
ncbi:SRPBCC family protein [Thalassococcus sp. CAU 1522]|uniref:SRPBCC family protein n=1 Tax=Thalassococcus arenae TaxID=2851652 RepID=A0ABS6N3U0_9RHOB|nr:SRPBCC family protein [Thalassococcus arenae]MBV2358688.1 SRPBCC family protein [Thalassococcus arenae]